MRYSRLKKTFSTAEVFESASMGATFDFYSSKATQFIIEDLSKILNKNIVLTNTDAYLPTPTNSILIKEYEGIKPKYHLCIAQEPYKTINFGIINTNKWITENAQTTNDTLLKVSLSFNHGMLPTLETISEMQSSKLILKFDESYIYKRFPDQESSPYALSVKRAGLLNKFTTVNLSGKNLHTVLTFPNESYFGIDFTNKKHGILEFNYIGGKDYSHKTPEINDILEYYVIKTYQSLNEDDYTEDEINELKRLTNNYEKLQESYNDFGIFKKTFNKINVSIDLKTDEQLLKTFWPQIRENLFNAMVNANFQYGEYNVDSTFSKCQIRKASLNSVMLENYDLVSCNLTGVFKNCDIWNSKIKKARVYNGVLVSNNQIFESYINNVNVNSDNKIMKCYIKNNMEMINCHISESVIITAGIGKLAKLSEDCVIVNMKEPETNTNIGIVNDRIKDTKWIKSLTPHVDSGFANLYKKNEYLK